MSTSYGAGPKCGGSKTNEPKIWCVRTTTRLKRSEDETGALLILAIMFMTVISMICASLTFMATNGLNNTSKFASALSLQDASNSITQLAVQDLRYNFTASTLNASPPQPCWIPTQPPAPVSQEFFNGENVAVWCSTQWNPLSANTRVVTFSTCLDVGNVAVPSGTSSTLILQYAAACQANPILQAVVAFDDFPSTIAASNCSPLSNSTCGTTFSVLSWAFTTPVPSFTTVTATASTTSLCRSSREIDISNGAQLTGATSVNFMPPGSNNVVISYTGGVLSGSTTTATSLVACATSQMKSGTTYQVSVTTPSGTSTTVSLPF